MELFGSLGFWEWVAVAMLVIAPWAIVVAVERLVREFRRHNDREDYRLRLEIGRGHVPEPVPPGVVDRPV